MRVDYETISIIIGITFLTLNDLRYFLQNNYSEIIVKINFNQYLPSVISDTVRILDRESLINDKFFDLLSEYHLNNFCSPGSENLYEVLKVARMNWRKGKKFKEIELKNDSSRKIRK